MAVSRNAPNRTNRTRRESIGVEIMEGHGQLTSKQRRFVQAYLQHGNGAQAAREAGYSPKAAKEQATRLLTYAHVQAALRDARHRAQAQADVTAEQITAELAKIGLAEVGDPVKLPHKLKALELLIKRVHLANLEERLAALEERIQSRGGASVPSRLESRLKKVEEAITPPGKIICVTRYSCMDERAVQRAVRQQLGRVPNDEDIIYVVALTDFAECPEGPHTHAREGHR
jgi:hypothetical protein